MSVATIAGAPLFTPKLAHEMNIEAGNDHWKRLIFEVPDVTYIELSDRNLDEVVPAVDLKEGSLIFADPTTQPGTACLSSRALVQTSFGFREQWMASS